MAHIVGHVVMQPGKTETHAFRTLGSALNAASAAMNAERYFKVDVYDDNGKYITTAWGE